MELDIRGIKWKIYLLEEDAFVKKFGNETAALCHPNDHTLYFSTNEISLSHVIHELVHAYHACAGTNSADLSTDQMEELFAEMFSLYGVQLIRLARRILKWLKEELNNG